MVQRTNKTRFRPSPTNGPLSAVSTVPAKHADGDGGAVSHARDKDRSCRANVAARQTRLAATDVRKEQQCSTGSAVDTSSNNSSFTKSSQQSKSSSHIGSSRGDGGAKSHPRITCPVAVKSESCLRTTEVCVADAARATGSKLGEKCRTEQGDSVLNTGTAESDLHNGVCISELTVTQTSSNSSSKVPVSTSSPTVAHSASSGSRASVSMTEVRRSDSADIQQSSSDSDRQSFHLCRKSVSDDTLVERMTISGDTLIITLSSVAS